ncbi:phosphoribosyltransferase [Stutzerimonas urumqiensis]|uniref:phosphoribosyltransferase family protein n=1 Tax=Stutzerimonas urumqiensis TaxID=638269 RepID=UPI003BAB0DFC
MNYRSLKDLSHLSTQSASRIAPDVDLVVGIPRSGMLVASIIALKLNLPLTDLYAFLRNDELKKGSTRTYKRNDMTLPQQARKILLVDDSIASGKSMLEALERVRAVYAGEVVTLVAFGETHNQQQVDICMEIVKQPRVFEWNIMHHHFMSEACLDIDGVLCEDPTADDNDDGVNYLKFLTRARPLYIPSLKVAHLVTSRLEKYRPETEAWLAEHGVQYGQLHMLDLPSAAERRRLNMHHKFKAQVYARQKDASLFVESEMQQAIEIMKATKKPVYCIETNEMYTPSNLHALKTKAVRKGWGLKRRLVGAARGLASRFGLLSKPAA